MTEDDKKHVDAVEVFKNSRINILDRRVKYIFSKDPVLANYIRTKNYIDYYLSNSFSHFFVYTIIGQLISTQIANNIFAKFTNMCKNNFSPDNILKFSPDKLRSCGMSYKKANYILGFMQLLLQQQDYLNKISTLPDILAVKELIKSPGIGKWTAKMILMFYFDRQNIVPIEDFAFIRGYNHLYNTNKTPTQISLDFKRFEPYMSIASRYVYAYADDTFKNTQKKQ